MPGQNKDIDIFFNDPQVLLYLPPRTNDAAERIAATGQYEEASNFIKFTAPRGEIDIIVAPHLLRPQYCSGSPRTKPHCSSRFRSPPGSADKPDPEQSRIALMSSVT